MKQKRRLNTKQRILSMLLSVVVCITFLSAGFIDVSASSGNATLDIRKQYSGTRGTPFNLIVHDERGEPVDLEDAGITLSIKYDHDGWEPYSKYLSDNGYSTALEHGELLIPSYSTVRIEGLEPGDYHVLEFESEIDYDIEFHYCLNWDDDNDSANIFCPFEEGGCPANGGGKGYTTDPLHPITLTANQVSRICFHNEEIGGGSSGLGPGSVSTTFTKRVTLLSGSTAPPQQFSFSIMQTWGPDHHLVYDDVGTANTTGEGDYTVNVSIYFTDLLPETEYIFQVTEASFLPTGWTGGGFIELFVKTDEVGISDYYWSPSGAPGADVIENFYTDPNPPPPKYPYKIIYYVDEADTSDGSYIDNGPHYLGTKAGTTEFEEDYPFALSDVDADFPGGWIDAFKPDSDYKSGEVEYFIEYITTDEGENVVIVVYKPIVTPPTPPPETYPYKILYYKDDVDNDPQKDNYLGSESGETWFEVDYQLLVGDVNGDFSPRDWLNLKRPPGYKPGTVQDGYPIITVDLEKNVVIVLYLPEDPPVNNPPVNNPPGNPPGGIPPDNNPPDNNPPDNNPPGNNPPGNPPDENSSGNSTSDDDPPGNNSQGNNAQSNNTPSQPGNPGGTSRELPPNPNVPGRELLPDGDVYIEYDEAGVPLGSWSWCNDDEMWLFSMFPPVSELPRTGIGVSHNIYLLLLGFSLAAMGAVIIRISVKRQSANK